MRSRIYVNWISKGAAVYSAYRRFLRAANNRLLHDDFAAGAYAAAVLRRCIYYCSAGSSCRYKSGISVNRSNGGLTAAPAERLCCSVGRTDISRQPVRISFIKDKIGTIQRNIFHADRIRNGQPAGSCDAAAVLRRGVNHRGSCVLRINKAADRINRCNAGIAAAPGYAFVGSIFRADRRI